jgi:actin, other eukaryote
MADEDAEALVIDNGSGSIKAGIAGEDAPKVRSSALAQPRVGLALLTLSDRHTR